jgi:signal transduction histidine kinase
MVNEALNNVRKHSPARACGCACGSPTARLHLHVRDDGGTVAAIARRFEPAVTAPNVHKSSVARSP